MINSDPFNGLHFVSENKYGNMSRLILRDLDGNFYTKFFNGRKWTLPRKMISIDESAKLKRLMKDLTNWRE